MKIELAKFDELFLEYSWKWLNDPEIAEMVSASVSTKEEQLAWYRKIQQLTDYLIWGLVVDKIPIGVCGIKKISNSDCEYWGYLGEKECWGKGFGKEMMILMEDEARNRRLESIWLQVNENNFRAISLYKKMGYEIEKMIDNKLYMRKKV